MLKTLIAQIKDVKKASILAPAFVSLEVILEVLIPFLMSLIIDYGVEKQDMKMIIILGILMIVAAFASLYAGAMSGKYASYASAGYARNLRQAMYHNILLTFGQ